MSTPLPFPKPPPGSPYATMWMAELDADQRAALPAEYHRPLFDALGQPRAWVCTACWGDGWTTSWPCAAAVSGGVELARSLDVEFLS